MEQNTQEQNTRSEDTPLTLPHHKNTGMAVVAYCLFFIPLLTEAKNDTFVMYHARQSFILFVAYLVTGIFTIIPTPFIIMVWPVSIGLIVLWIIGIVHAVGGKEEPIPFLGQFSNKVPF